MYKFISLIVFSLLIIGSVNAITEEEKALIQEGIEKYSGDPDKLGAFVQVLDDTYDLSNDEQLRQEVISSAENSGLNEESFSNIKEGKAPEPKKTAEELAVEDGVVEEVAVEEPFPLWVIIIVILALAIIGIVLYFIRRKKV